MTIHFDTLEYSNALEKAGITRVHAEAIARVQAQALKDLIETKLVTQEQLRSELSQVETRLTGKIAETETRLRGEFGESETRLRGEIGESEMRLRGEIGKLRSDIRGDMAELKAELQSDFRRQIDELRLLLRSLQFGGAITAFAVTAIVLMTRLIR